MNCESAADLFFDEQDHALTPQAHATLHLHLDSCDNCRTEFAALDQGGSRLAEGLRAMTANLDLSPAFYQNLGSALDAVDAERVQAAEQQDTPEPAGAQERGLRIVRRALAGQPGASWLRSRGRRGLAALALVAALIGSLLATGNLQQAYAALRAHLYFLPEFGLGQVERTALVAVGPVSTVNGRITLTVTSFVSGRTSTLLAFRLSGPGLSAGNGAAPVADAVAATLTDKSGRIYQPTFWLPPNAAAAASGVSGVIAFEPLAASAHQVRFDATRLPLAPLGKPWTVTINLRPAGSVAGLSATQLDRADGHKNITLTVTDLLRSPRATVVDLQAAIAGGAFAGGQVVSLDPNQPTDYLAPVLRSHGQSLYATPSIVPLQLRHALLNRPELVFAAVDTRSTLVLRVAAVRVRMPSSLPVRARLDARSPTLARLAGSLLTLRASVIPIPSGLGLHHGRQVRINVGFPPADVGGALHSINLVIDGVGREVSRDTPTIDLPFTNGASTISTTLQGFTYDVPGPWNVNLS